MDEKNDILSLTFDELQDYFADIGEKPFRGRQLFRWLHKGCVADFDEMTDLAKGLRQQLPELARITRPEITEEQLAEDGTRKYRFGLHDGLEIEGVFMPEAKQATLCISTQVGCAMGCAFCATGTMGLVRNLSAGEIVGQVEAVVSALRDGAQDRPVSNVVFMGMGEPLANLDAVSSSVDILLHPMGLNLGRRHLTVSTVGLLPAMERFVHEVPVRLAVSLNATTDEQRSRLMPINRKYPIAELMETCRNLPLQQNYRITFEYVMFKGINDQDEDIERLAKLVKGVHAKVNLIPYNPCEGLPFEAPDEARVRAFADRLSDLHVTAMVRRSRGDKLRAACGQLVTGLKSL